MYHQQGNRNASGMFGHRNHPRYILSCSERELLEICSFLWLSPKGGYQSTVVWVLLENVTVTHKKTILVSQGSRWPDVATGGLTDTLCWIYLLQIRYRNLDLGSGELRLKSRTDRRINRSQTRITFLRSDENYLPTYLLCGYIVY